MICGEFNGRRDLRPGSLAWRLRQARWKVFLGLIEHLPRLVPVLDAGGGRMKDETGNLKAETGERREKV